MPSRRVKLGSTTSDRAAARLRFMCGRWPASWASWQTTSGYGRKAGKNPCRHTSTTDTTKWPPSRNCWNQKGQRKAGNAGPSFTRVRNPGKQTFVLPSGGKSRDSSLGTGQQRYPFSVTASLQVLTAGVVIVKSNNCHFLVNPR